MHLVWWETDYWEERHGYPITCPIWGGQIADKSWLPVVDGNDGHARLQSGLQYLAIRLVLSLAEKRIRLGRSTSSQRVPQGPAHFCGNPKRMGQK